MDQIDERVGHQCPTLLFYPLFIRTLWRRTIYHLRHMWYKTNESVWVLDVELPVALYLHCIPADTRFELICTSCARFVAVVLNGSALIYNTFAVMIFIVASIIY